MMRRDFGSYSNNHTPPGGYRHHAVPGPNAPHFYSESRRPAIPAPGRHELGRIATPTIFEPLESEVDEYHEYGVELGQPELPVQEYRKDVIEAIKNNQAVIVVSETGGGKSTQVPQIALDSGLFDRIYMTQPRRIASYSVAGRIQEELNGRLGPKRAGGLVGFQTAEKSTFGTRTRIGVLTDGIEAVRQLSEEPIEPRSLHIIDEVHEMNTNMEVTIAVSRQKMTQNPDAKFVFMSATMNAPQLQQYLGESLGYVPPIIEVPGRSFGLTRHEESQSTVVEQAAKWAGIIAREKNLQANNILIFDPGKREIADHIDAIRKKLSGTMAANAQILPLHARLSKGEQQRVIAPSKDMKIIVSTDVAQTSLTIPGVRVVIDSGMSRYVELDDEGVQGLGMHETSQADCDQRAGRAGRLCPGDYVLTRLDEHTEHTPYIQRKKFPKAEILRTEIDRTTLRFAAVDIDLAAYKLLHAIDPALVKESQKKLRQLGALDDQNRITERGLFMNAFPVRPTSGRMLYEARRFSPQVRAFVAVIAASLETGGLPYFAHDAGDEWKSLTEEDSSDYFAQLDIFIASQDMTKDKLAQYDLDVQNIDRAREQYAKIAKRLDAFFDNLLPPSQAERAAIEECIIAGMADWVYGHIGEGDYLRLNQHGEDKDVPRELSNRSVVRGKPDLVAANPYRVEYLKRGERRERHIIETIAVISDPSILGRVALGHCEWVEQGTLWRAGKLMSMQALKFAGVIDVGQSREHEAEPTDLNRQLLLQSILENPGPAQRQLRFIKTELEELQHLAAFKLPKIVSQDDLLALLRRAIGEGLPEQGRIDDNLRKLMEIEEINLENYLPADTQAKIKRAAIPRLDLPSGLSLRLRYRNGHPIVKQFHIHQLLNLPQEVTTPDGRNVLFPYHKQYYRVDELRQAHAKILETASVV